MRTLGILMAATTALCWSLLAIALKFALNFVSAETIIWFRFFFAFTVLFLVLALRRQGKFILPASFILKA